LTTKQYRPYYEKGRIMPEMETLPFGYREIPVFFSFKYLLKNLKKTPD